MSPSTIRKRHAFSSPKRADMDKISLLALRHKQMLEKRAERERKRDKRNPREALKTADLPEMVCFSSVNNPCVAPYVLLKDTYMSVDK